jgi:hypothetical protein
LEISQGGVFFGVSVLDKIRNPRDRANQRVGGLYPGLLWFTTDNNHSGAYHSLAIKP